MEDLSDQYNDKFQFSSHPAIIRFSDVESLYSPIGFSIYAELILG